jgi:nucleoside-diphosphate-sugar epimerase
MQTVLLAGGTGYLGSRMMEALLDAGHRLVVLKRPSSSLARITRFLGLGLVELRDVDDPLEGVRADAVLHCATDYGRSGQGRESMVEANVLFPLRLLGWAATHGVRAFLNADTALPPVTSDYALSKAQFRQWLERDSAPPVRVNAAIEHFYGPHDDPSRFVSHVIQRLLAQAPRLELTAGEQERDFIHVDDVVTALARMLDWSAQAPAGLHRFEVGTGQTISIRGLVERIRDLTGNQATRLAFGALPYRPGEVMKSHADIGALTGLGWRPIIPLEEGLRRTIEAERSRPRP